MVCKRQEQCVFGEKCVYHVGSVLPKCSIFEQKPPIKQTEQEYIQTCNTKQLVEVLFSWYKLGRLDVINKHTEVKKDWLIEHLKQPHIVKE